MYEKILVPVDLAHIDRLGKAIATAADLAGHYAIPVCFVAVTAAAPGPVAHTPDEFARKLEEFARNEAAARGIDATAKAYVSHDPSADLEATLIKAVEETGADLIVTGSHLPGLPEHVFTSNSGYLAAHARISVFVVR